MFRRQTLERHLEGFEVCSRMVVEARDGVLVWSYKMAKIAVYFYKKWWHLQYSIQLVLKLHRRKLNKKTHGILMIPFCISLLSLIPPEGEFSNVGELSSSYCVRQFTGWANYCLYSAVCMIFLDWRERVTDKLGACGKRVFTHNGICQADTDMPWNFSHLLMANGLSGSSVQIKKLAFLFSV